MRKINVTAKKSNKVVKETKNVVKNSSIKFNYNEKTNNMYETYSRYRITEKMLNMKDWVCVSRLNAYYKNALADSYKLLANNPNVFVHPSGLIGVYDKKKNTMFIHSPKINKDTKKFVIGLYNVNYNIAKLVALLFKPNKNITDKGKFKNTNVVFKNGNTYDCRIENLAWDDNDKNNVKKDTKKEVKKNIKNDIKKAIKAVIKTVKVVSPKKDKKKNTIKKSTPICTITKHGNRGAITWEINLVALVEK